MFSTLGIECHITSEYCQDSTECGYHTHPDGGGGITVCQSNVYIINNTCYGPTGITTQTTRRCNQDGCAYC
ncbi:hypothetical protein D3C80_1624070 [compost metagenome]